MKDTPDAGSAARDDAGHADRLRGWFEANGRDLVIRSAHTPWAVLVAEVMSQQTQVARVAAAWPPFIDRWPTPARLAVASTGDLLDAWAGLGYNRRALMLREAARAIEERHGGLVPPAVEDLLRLPGVGPYTARAIAAHAFSTPVAPLDVNVRRVLARLVGSPMSARALQDLGDGLVWQDDSAGWANAMIDLAAAVCTSRRPRCGTCPLADGCQSRGRDMDVRTPQPTPAFADTTRWLRGELLRRLRNHPRGAWVTVTGPVGRHSPAAVERALGQLEAEGFLQRSGGGVRIAA